MKKYFDKLFFKAALIIAMPIVAQQLVSSLAQLIDNLMVGSINGQAIAGVGAVNSILFVAMVASFGIAEGASIFIAQQYGAGKREKIANSLAISLVIIVIMGITVSLGIKAHDEFLIKLFIRDTDAMSMAALDYGMKYLNVIILGYWVLMVNIVIGSSFRAVGDTKVPMIAGIVAVLTNTGLNFVLIPLLGVQGAAIATITARVIEFMILFFILKRVQKVFVFNFASFTTIKVNQVIQIAKKTAPLTLNEILWGLGTSTLMALYGARNITDLASIQITYTIANLLFVAMAGFGVAVSVLIGQKLGQGNFEEAVENSKKLLVLSAIIGVIFLVLAQILAFVIPSLYGNVGEIIQTQSANLLRIIGFAYPIYIITVTFFFTLRAGGDSLGVLIMDAGTMWFLSIPAGMILVNYTNVSVYLIFIGVQSFDIIKVLIGYYRYRRYDWVKNIV